MVEKVLMELKYIAYLVTLEDKHGKIFMNEVGINKSICYQDSVDDLE